MPIRTQTRVDQECCTRAAALRRVISAFVAFGFVFFSAPVLAQIEERGSASGNTATGNVSPAGVHTAFKIKFVEFDNAYLSVGPGSVLSKGMKLLVRRSSNGAGKSNAGEVVAELRVKFVSTSSAICEVLTAAGDFGKGDLAYLTPEEIATVTKQQAINSASTRQTALSSQPVTPVGAKMAAAAPLSTSSDNGKPVVVANPAAPNQQPTNQTPSATVASVTPPVATVTVASAQASTPMKPSSVTQSIAPAQPSPPTQNQPAVTPPTIQQTTTAQASKADSSSAATIASTTSQSVTAAVQTPRTLTTTPVDSTLQTSAAANVVQGQAQPTNTSVQNAQPAQTPDSATTQKTASSPKVQVSDAGSGTVSSSTVGIGGAQTQPMPAAVQESQAPAVTQINSSSQTPIGTNKAQTQPSSTNSSMQTAQVAPAPPSTAAQKSASREGAEVNDTKKGSESSAAAQPSNTTAASSPSKEIAQDSQETVLPDVQTIFKIKFVAQDTVYLSAGTATGLTAGMKLIVKHSELDINQNGTLAKASQAATIAELEVISVASSSAVCSVKNKTVDIQPGDLAFMDQATAEALAEKRALSATRKFPQVVSFNEGDPLEEEVREDVPRPPLPEVNRIRGRFGFDYGDIRSSGAIVSNNSQIGMIVRTDFTRIGGSYWNLSGYWRGRLTNTSNVEQPTLQDLINRTYTLNLSYSNPTSPWVAGFGRLYLPWATSLDTIDGGYFGRKAGKHLLLGLFAGSTPDPTSWDYNPNRRIGGVFLNLEGGSFDSLRVSSTSGLALSTLNWQVDRPFIFFENGLYFKRYLSIYDSTQADDPRPIAGLNAVGPGLSRNFFTLRFQPFERLSFDVDHNYFRDVPTFDTALIATGLLDKYLFQGLSAGVRVEPIRHITLYASVGKSSRTGDTSGAWNEMYGITFAQIPKTGLRLDVRTSTFDSSFGSGKYRSVSISRNFTEILHLEAQVGQQFLASQLTSQTESRFVNATLDSNLGRNYFIQGGYTVQHGGTFNYNQWTITFGYRFDNHMQGVGK